ncbi:helicase RepA family protein [Hydrogenophaga sp.]|uniref:helicase RepA family protein n=1 Tax=Hydrogenophaga sp. TaxID=1904254 RepID=UPI001AD131E9|nr:helicase RepA family protein [Hydrogenophaga sp.]MBN9372134.1 AAA family ATPase [Hydrogenophaga sp.]
MSRPFLTPLKLDITKLLRTSPPMPDHVLPGLPVGALGLLVAPGGKGKTMLLLQTAVALALGKPFLNGVMGKASSSEPARVVLFAAEETVDELHRRLHQVLRQLLEAHADLKDSLQQTSTLELLNNNLHIYPMAGAARLRLDGAEGSEQELEFLREAAKGARLVVLDPLRQFHSGDENDSWVMTNLVHQCLSIATQEHCAFILAHHTNKQATVTGYGDKAAASRGSAALTDAARWQLNLSELDPGLARERGIPKVDAWQYVKVDLAKANYLPEQPPVVLHKGVGGVLETVSEKVRSKGASK